MESNIMKIYGILQSIAATEDHLRHLRTALANNQSPQEAHDLNLKLRAAEDRLGTITAHAQSNTTMIAQIEMLIADLKQASHQSADRILARRELENASMRLRRENGDPA